MQNALQERALLTTALELFGKALVGPAKNVQELFQQYINVQ